MTAQPADCQADSKRKLLEMLKSGHDPFDRNLLSAEAHPDVEAVAYDPIGALPDDSRDAALRYIRDWCPDHVKHYIDSLKAEQVAGGGGVDALIKQWRTLAKESKHLRSQQHTLRYCANQLEALPKRDDAAPVVLKTLAERAWDIYCFETRSSMHTADYWRELPPNVQIHYLSKALDESCKRELCGCG